MKLDVTGSDSNTLDFFDQAGNDGSKLRWAHGVNSHELVSKALQGKCRVMTNVSVEMKSLKQYTCLICVYRISH